MDSKKLFEKYYARLRTEAILKSLVCGLIVGFGVDFIIAFVTWFFCDVFSLWFIIALGVGLVAGFVVATVLYFKAFRPTPEIIAQRVDELGLEERVITMYRYSDSDSFIAQRQREDAKSRMSGISGKSLRIIVSRTLIIAAAIVGVVGLSMTTVNALVGLGILDDPTKNLRPSPELDYVTVTYEVSDPLGGTIEGGDFLQILNKGEDADPVYALPADGYIFLYWEEDRNMDPERHDANVQYDLTFTAVFEETVPGGTSDGDELSDVPPDEPPPSDDQIDDPDDADNQNTPPNSENEYDGNDVAIHDKKTPYWENWLEYYNEAMERVRNDPTLTEEEKQMLLDFYNQLKAGIPTDQLESEE